MDIKGTLKNYSDEISKLIDKENDICDGMILLISNVMDKMGETEFLIPSNYIAIDWCSKTHLVKSICKNDKREIFVKCCDAEFVELKSCSKDEIFSIANSIVHKYEEMAKVYVVLVHCNDGSGVVGTFKNKSDAEKALSENIGDGKNYNYIEINDEDHFLGMNSDNNPYELEIVESVLM